MGNRRFVDVSLVKELPLVEADHVLNTDASFVLSQSPHCLVVVDQ